MFVTVLDGGGQYRHYDTFFVHNPDYKMLINNFKMGAPVPLNKPMRMVGLGKHHLALRTCTNPRTKKRTDFRPLIMLLQDPTTSRVYLVSTGKSDYYDLKVDETGAE